MATDKQIKSDAGYVEVSGFSLAGAGYFCGTCRALDYEDNKRGFCTGLKVPVKTYGCCNYWKLAPDSQVRGANGVKLTVFR